MSAPISLDDSDSSSGELPEIGFAVKSSTHSGSTVRRTGSEEKENVEIMDHCFDLTQEDDFVTNDKEAIALSGSSTRSLKELNNPAKRRQRSVSMHSDSTVELLDSDMMFDQVLAPRLADPGVASLSGASGSSAGSSGYGTGSSGSVAVSFGSATAHGVKRRKSVGSLEDKPQKKTAAAADRASKKQKMAEERAARLAASEMNKMYKPGECMKYMHIELHPSLQSAWFMADLPREAAGAGARLRARGDAGRAGGVPGLVTWRREGGAVLSSSGQLGLTRLGERCTTALLIESAEEIAPYVQAHTLASHVARVRDAVDCQLTLVVFGVKDYFKPAGRKKQKDKLITEIELEMAFTDVLVSAGCDCVSVDTPNELALLIVQFTKAIAEAPHKHAKRACDEQADFYMRGDNKKCVSVDKNGNGLSRLWQQMIAILPHSSLETSRAVCSNYKSPLALYEALEDLNSVNEIADIGVDRAGVPGARARRIGPEFARKLRTLFTSDDGNMLMG
ncbi:hypothetical protein JYU34_011734 [Plutella xylostella]|uniref:Crossover junction endonuclease EME1 n=1 Tax=Plutella xylostella TaxID=51655 RepID=A0ABQ7QDG7_PLUXY|nr:hypothetical protein JYU34_011734 [Plutella xylostella]